MFRTKTWLTLLLAACAVQGVAAYANVNVTENFTGAATVNPWFYFGGACLTASSVAGTGSNSYGPGTPPGLHR